MRFWFYGPRIFGVRTGLSLGAEDFRSRSRSTIGAEPNSDKFVYVVSGGDLVKIGISADPSTRLAQLQNVSAVPLSLSWVGAPKGDAAAIERETHKMLDKYRRGGEWFGVGADAAVGAIHSAAFRYGQPVLDLTPEQAQQIRLVGAQLAATANKPPSTALSRVAVGILQLVVGFVLAVALIIFVFVRIGRI